MTKDQALRKVVVAHERRTAARLKFAEAIKDAHDAGASLREIADLIDMSHAGIAKILRTQTE